ncbi:MAG: hypothetical protein NC309_08650, partial [Ruminococcus sp.]|nr:hypothetical protein [Ruminococcus sp.]
MFRIATISNAVVKIIINSSYVLIKPPPVELGGGIARSPARLDRHILSLFICQYIRHTIY